MFYLCFHADNGESLILSFLYSYIIGNEVQPAAGAHGEERRGWIVTEQQYSPYPASDGVLSDLDGKIQNAENITEKIFSGYIRSSWSFIVASRRALVILCHRNTLSF